MPLEHVTVQEMHAGTNGRLIIHIQDAHANLSGQQSLSKALDRILTQYDLKLVLVEGSARDSSLDEIRKLAPLKEWKIIARRFLYDGIISGEEYLNLTSEHPMKIIGVEYRDLYDEAVKAYAAIVDRRKDILHYLYQAKVSLDRLKVKMYPQALKDYEAKKGPEDGPGSIDFKTGFAELLKLAEAAEFPVSDLAQIEKLRALIAKESLVDFDKAGKEQEAILKGLTVAGATEEVREFSEASRRLRFSQVSQFLLIQKLLQTASDREVPMENFPDLMAYAGYLEKFSDLKMDELMAQLEFLEDKVYEKLLPSDDARKVRAIDRFLGLLGNAYKLQMSSQEFGMFTFNEKDFQTESWLAFMNRQLIDLGFFESLVPYQPYLEDARTDFGRFYQLVGERDIAFVENANRIMNEQGERAAVLIAGGYHTAHLTELLRNEGTSYIVLTPVVTDTTDHERYEELLLSHLKDQEKRLASSSSAKKDTGPYRAQNVATTKIPRGLRLMSLGSRLARDGGFSPEATAVMESRLPADQLQAIRMAASRMSLDAEAVRFDPIGEPGENRANLGSAPDAARMSVDEQLSTGFILTVEQLRLLAKGEEVSEDSISVSRLRLRQAVAERGSPSARANVSLKVLDYIEAVQNKDIASAESAMNELVSLLGNSKIADELIRLAAQSAIENFLTADQKNLIFIMLLAKQDLQAAAVAAYQLWTGKKTLPIGTITPRWIEDYQALRDKDIQSFRLVRGLLAALLMRAGLVRSEQLEPTNRAATELVEAGGQAVLKLAMTGLPDRQPSRDTRTEASEAEAAILATASKIQSNAPAKVCFVCTANMNRSAAGHIILDDAARKQGRTNLQVVSGGLLTDQLTGYDGKPVEGAPIHADYVEPLRAQGVERSVIEGFRSHQITAEMVQGTDLIVVASPAHKQRLLEMFPELAPVQGRIVLFTQMDPDLARHGDEMPDPQRGDAAVAGGISKADLLSEIKKIADRLLSGPAAGTTAAADRSTPANPILFEPATREFKLLTAAWLRWQGPQGTVAEVMTSSGPISANTELQRRILGNLTVPMTLAQFAAQVHQDLLSIPTATYDEVIALAGPAKAGDYAAAKSAILRTLQTLSGARLAVVGPAAGRSLEAVPAFGALDAEVREFLLRATTPIEGPADRFAVEYFSDEPGLSRTAVVEAIAGSDRLRGAPQGALILRGLDPTNPDKIIQTQAIIEALLKKILGVEPDLRSVVYPLGEALKNAVVWGNYGQQGKYVVVRWSRTGAELDMDIIDQGIDPNGEKSGNGGIRLAGGLTRPAGILPVYAGSRAGVKWHIGKYLDRTFVRGEGDDAVYDDPIMSADGRRLGQAVRLRAIPLPEIFGVDMTAPVTADQETVASRSLLPAGARLPQGPAVNGSGLEAFMPEVSRQLAQAGKKAIPVALADGARLAMISPADRVSQAAAESSQDDASLQVIAPRMGNFLQTLSGLLASKGLISSTRPVTAVHVVLSDGLEGIRDDQNAQLITEIGKSVDLRVVSETGGQLGGTEVLSAAQLAQQIADSDSSVIFNLIGSAEEIQRIHERLAAVSPALLARVVRAPVRADKAAPVIDLTGAVMIGALLAPVKDSFNLSQAGETDLTAALAQARDLSMALNPRIRSALAGKSMALLFSNQERPELADYLDLLRQASLNPFRTLRELVDQVATAARMAAIAA